MNIKKNSNNELFKKIKKFEKENPELMKTLKLLDISMEEYNQAVNAMEPTVTFTSNSTSTSFRG